MMGRRAARSAVARCCFPMARWSRSEMPRPRSRTISPVSTAPADIVTPGVIDVHSHLGDYPSPGVAAHEDGNEMTNPTTPEVWAEHSVWPQDPGFTRALANGGVTALQILPGSGNLMGGRSVTLKNVPSAHGAGDEIPRRALWPQDGLRRESQARLWRQGARADRPGWAISRSTRQTWARRARPKRRGRPQGRRNLADAMDTLRGVLDGEIIDPEPLLPRRRDGAGARYGEGVRLQGHARSTTRSKPTRSPICSSAKPASARRCGPTGTASRWKPMTRSTKTRP